MIIKQTKDRHSVRSLNYETKKTIFYNDFLRFFVYFNHIMNYSFNSIRFACIIVLNIKIIFLMPSVFQHSHLYGRSPDMIFPDWICSPPMMVPPHMDAFQRRLLPKQLV
jgi:hypothetical protein